MTEQVWKGEGGKQDDTPEMESQEGRVWGERSSCLGTKSLEPLDPPATGWRGDELELLGQAAVLEEGLERGKC